MAKLIRLQQFKRTQAESKIAKVQEGYEGGIYSLDQAKKRIAELQSTLAKSDREIQRLQGSTKAPTPDATDVRALREELRSLRDRNLNDATFAEKLEVICGLGIEVYPSEDLKSMRVACQLDLDHVRSSPRSGETSTNLQANEECGPEIECGKVVVGSPSHSIDRTPDTVFKAVFAFV